MAPSVWDSRPKSRASYNGSTPEPAGGVPVSTLPILLTFNSDAAIEAAIRILIVVALGVIAASIIRRAVGPVIRVAIREQMAGEPEAEISKRIATLSDVLYKTAVTVIGALCLVTVLPEFGIAVGPLIAGLGLVGLAVGFGAQNLVRDVINGVEILIENQYARGDFVRLRTTTGGNISGVIQDINLRRTMLRDTDGAAHFISHGSIEVSSNLTRGYSQVSFLVSVSQGSDVDAAFSIINRVGAEVAREADFAAKIRQAPAAHGIERLGDSTLDIRVSGVTEPGEQWAVTTEMQRRLKAAFDAEGVRFKD
jgi:small conductance mechanosensitive channel